MSCYITARFGCSQKWPTMGIWRGATTRKMTTCNTRKDGKREDYRDESMSIRWGWICFSPLTTRHGLILKMVSVAQITPLLVSVVTITWTMMMSVKGTNIFHPHHTLGTFRLSFGRIIMFSCSYQRWNKVSCLGGQSTEPSRCVARPTMNDYLSNTRSQVCGSVP